jgi:hypothetical protein
MEELLWKDDWRTTRDRFSAWWRREGLLLWVTAPREQPREALPEPPPPANPTQQWIDPEYRLQRAEWEMSRTWYGAEAFPCFDPQIGPGNLATFVGATPEYAADTVWFHPCITDPDAHPPLRFDPAGRHFAEQMAIIEKALAGSRGRYLVGLPDLIEGIDILVSLRGMEALLEDMIDRPRFIEHGTREINEAWFDVFTRIEARVKDPWGATTWACFHLWGEGRTAKVQCDVSAAFSPAMYRTFVAPQLTAQCRWLDNSLYHLDGLQCLGHLDALLEIEELDAIQWTAGAGRAGDGDPQWYELYRRIRAAGKGVMATDVKPAEIIPLLDAVGPKGLFIVAEARSEDEARELERAVEAYR